MHHRSFFIFIVIALFIKCFFIYTTSYAPEGKFLFDSKSYLDPAAVLYAEKIFAEPIGNAEFRAVTYRTPGYPVFLAFFHEFLKIPLDGVIFIQIVLYNGWYTARHVLYVEMR